MINLFTTLLFILPFIIVPLKGIADPFRLPQEAFLDLIFMSIISCSFFSGLRILYRNKYLFWFSAWIFMTIIFTWYFPFTFVFNNKQGITFGTIPSTLHFILGLWAIFIILSYFKVEEYEKIAKTICLSAVLLTLFGIMQIVGFDPFGTIAKYQYEWRFSATLSNPNVLGSYLCLSFPMFFIFKEKKYILGALIVLAGIILSKSTLAILVTFMGFIFYLLLNFRNNKKFLISIGILIILFLLCVYINKEFLKIEGGFSGRVPIWKETLEKIKINSLFGQGLGRFKTWEIRDITHTRWLSPHNDWLEMIVGVGFVGISLLFLLIINSFKHFNYKLDNKIGFSYLTTFLMFLLLMCGFFVLKSPSTALLGLISFCAVETL